MFERPIHTQTHTHTDTHTHTHTHTQGTDRITGSIKWSVKIADDSWQHCVYFALLFAVYWTCWFKCCAPWTACRDLYRLQLRRSGRLKMAEAWNWTLRTRCVLANCATSTTLSTWNTWRRTNDLMRCWRWNTLCRSRFLGVYCISSNWFCLHWFV